jgi:hypothetical protein
MKKKKKKKKEKRKKPDPLFIKNLLSCKNSRRRRGVQQIEKKVQINVFFLINKVVQKREKIKIVKSK